MKQNEKKLLFGHIILLLLELIVILNAFSEDGLSTLRYYTTDSNLLCGLSSFLYILFKLPELNKEGKGVVSRYFQNKEGDKKVELPIGHKGIGLLRFISTTSLMVTFVVVLLVLGPEKGYAYEFLEGRKLFSHLICPFLSLLLFVLEEGDAPLKWISYALFATLLYAIPLILLNPLGLVSGPYSFLKIREQSLGKTVFWIVTILSGNALLALGAIFLQSLKKKRKKQLTG